MNTCAWLIGRLATFSARVMLRWAETQYGRHAVRLWVYSNVVASPDEPSLVGITGKRRGSRELCSGDLAVALPLFQRCAIAWTLYELERRRGLTLSSWKPGRPVLEWKVSNR
jgi:hypothetical protein